MEHRYDEKKLLLWIIALEYVCQEGNQFFGIVKLWPFMDIRVQNRVYYCLLQFTLAYYDLIWLNCVCYVYSGLLWFTMLYCGFLWFTVVYPVCYGLLMLFCLLWHNMAIGIIYFKRMIFLPT